MSEESVSICLTCGGDINYKQNTKECRSCRAERRGYLPTPEEIEAHCKVFQQEWKDRNAARKNHHDMHHSGEGIRRYKVVDSLKDLSGIQFHSSDQ
jgi:hypothetical protein